RSIYPHPTSERAGEVLLVWSSFGDAQLARGSWHRRRDRKSTPRGDALRLQVDDRGDLGDLDAITLSDRLSVVRRGEASAHTRPDHQRRPETMMGLDDRRARRSRSWTSTRRSHRDAAAIDLPERRPDDGHPALDPARITARDSRKPAAHLGGHGRDAGRLGGRERRAVDRVGVAEAK